MQQYDQIKEHLLTYSPAANQTVYRAAQGVRFIDEDGNSRINLNDIACVLGYGHPRFTQTLAQLVQTKMLGHAGVLSPDKEQLIANFMRATHGDFHKLLVTGSGGETVDWAIKAARRATGKDGVISFRNALHGRSFAGAYISDIAFRKEGFGSGLEHVYFWDYPGDGRACEPEADTFTDIAAVIIEPYQAGGMASPSKAYWQWLRRYTEEHGIVLIFDEIQTGFGKTGSFFAYEEAGIVPDILLAGKGMSNGFGLGAMLLSEKVSAGIAPHAMSGGSADNDLMCSIVNLVFDIYEEEQLLAHVREMGDMLRAGMRELLAAHGVTGVFRGQGLFFSVELPEGLAMRVAQAAWTMGVMVGRSGEKLIFRTPLVITAEDVREVCRVLREAVAQSL